MLATHHRFHAFPTRSFCRLHPGRSSQALAPILRTQRCNESLRATVPTQSAVTLSFRTVTLSSIIASILPQKLFPSQYGSSPPMPNKFPSRSSSNPDLPAALVSCMARCLHCDVCHSLHLFTFRFESWRPSLPFQCPSSCSCRASWVSRFHRRDCVEDDVLQLCDELVIHHRGASKPQV